MFAYAQDLAGWKKIDRCRPADGELRGGFFSSFFGHVLVAG